MSRSVCVVTGSRADYGLLFHPMRAIAAHPELTLRIAATGMHLSPEFGHTISTIEADGWRVDHRVETLLSSDTAVGVGKSIGLGVAGFAELFDRDRPDLLFLTGDRFEMFAAATAGLIAGIPMAHSCGGDVTEGAYDEAFRHGMTKMAHLHFPTNADAARRIVQLGEAPERVHLVGSPGLDAIRHLQGLPRDALAADLGIPADLPWLLVTFHPATNDLGSPLGQVDEMLAAIEPFLDRHAVVITMSNADNDGRALNKRLTGWAAPLPHVTAVASLGRRSYLSLLGQVAAVIGNSSSGLYEAPSFATPAVNIGSRQAGRPRASSVFDCPPERRAIIATIKRALTTERRDVINPYGDGHTSRRIVDVIAGEPDWPSLLTKSFHDLRTPAGA